MPLPITRRTLFGTAAGGLLGGLLPSSQAKAASLVTLTAGRRSLDVNGRAASVFGITQPDGTAGLVTKVGTPFRVVLQNDAGVDTLIHWHGLTPPYRQDGVPGISAPAIASGGTAAYDFPLTFPGTFWMHSHQGLQEQAMMSAPLIVRDAKDSADRQEVVLLLHDFSFKSPEEIYDGLRRVTASAGMGTDDMAGMKMPPAPPSGASLPADTGPAGMVMDLNDVVYDAFLANDRTLDDPFVVRVEPRGRILLRIINASAASNFHIDLGAAQATLSAVDGQPVQPITGSVFPVAMAQRIDLELQLAADQQVLPVFAVLEGERKRTGIVLATANGQVGRLSPLAETTMAPVNFDMEQRLRAATSLAPKPADRVHKVDLTGVMAGYVWGLNGMTYDRAEPLRVAMGQRVELVMTNKTPMSHPMHLHGHSFQVVAVDGQRFPGAVRDTVLVPPMRSVTIAFEADNPGQWAFHCHNLYHPEAGMMTTVNYEGF